MARPVGRPDSRLKDVVITTAFEMVANKDCNPCELIEHLTKHQKNIRSPLDLRSSEGHTLLHEMVHKGRLSLFIVLLHMGWWKVLTEDRVPRESLSDYSGCTVLDIAKKKKTRKPIDELNLYDRWEDSLTPLMTACRLGDIERVKESLEKVGETGLHVQDNNGMNALYWAVVSGQKPILELLLNKGLDPKVRNEKQETLLHVATMFGKIDLVDVLISDKRCQFDPYLEDLNMKSAYDRCAENGDMKMLKELLKCGKNPKDSFLVLTSYNGRQECVKYCINSLKMNMNGTDIYSRTALLRACEGSREQVVSFLIKKGAHLKNSTSNNRNVFHMVAENGSIEIMNELIRAFKSAKENFTELLNQKDRYTGTDLCFLIRGTDKKREAWHYCEVDRWKCPVFLKRTKAGNVDVAQYGEMVRSGWGINPPQSDVTFIENIFKKRKLDPNSAEDMTPLHLAAFKGHPRIVEVLLKHGAKPNVKDSFGLTPILLAAAKGELNIVKCLQAAGASLKEYSNDGQNITSIAKFNEHDDIKQYIASLDIFQLSENFVGGTVHQIREELSPERLNIVRQSGKDVKKHIIETLREFRIDINEFLVGIDSGPVLQATDE